jgi:hypothetical protein
MYAIFTRRNRNGAPRVMHAAREGARETVCKRPIGRGTGLVRDGDYHNNRPCRTCWPATR